MSDEQERAEQAEELARSTWERMLPSLIEKYGPRAWDLAAVESVCMQFARSAAESMLEIEDATGKLKAYKAANPAASEINIGPEAVDGQRFERGLIYWVTDRKSWDQHGNMIQARFWICLADTIEMPTNASGAWRSVGFWV